MKNTAPDGKKTSLWGYLTLLCGIAGMLFVLAMTFLAVKDMAAVYRTFAEADLSQDFSGTLSYDDRLYAMMGCGIGIEPQETDKRERMDAFLDDALRQIDYRISAAGLLYAMMIGVAPALFLWERYGDRKGRHTLAAALSPAAAWVVFLLAQALLRAAFRVPMKVLSGNDLFTLCVSLFSVCGGCCALGWLLRRVRFRKIAAFAAIPLAFALLVTGMLAEGGLFCSPETESFDYLFEAQPEGYETAVYDEAKNAVVIKGEEYPPEIAPNPDHFTGIAAVGAAAYEAVNPFGGSGVAMVGQFDGTAIPGWVLPLYLCKAVCWIALPATLPFRKKRAACAEEAAEG